MTDGRPADVADTDTYITRVFEAPRDLVFRFWLEPEQLSKWWGPAGFTAPAEHIVFERFVGGRFQLCMIEPEQHTEIWTHGEILEFVEPELVAIQMRADLSPFGMPPIDVQLRVQFHDHGERTRITLHQGPFAADETRRGNDEGWTTSLDRLDTALAAYA
ncbi:SRPBCC family protein [Luethyella okanaganae]|uniref:SRPBCC domain-containing protein n=1 Tax=Luethyella okanaganae TaxID=69372 RepID=A0ABW1VK58_9MICO